MSGQHQGWADLPDVLLHSIVALSVSFSDLLAFAATCRSWCDAFSSYPSKATFSALFPPVLLQPDVTVRSPRLPPKFGDKHPCRVIDLASHNSRLCCQIPLLSLSRGNTPRIHILRMQVRGEISTHHLANIYLVACGDMLVLVGWGSFLASGDTFEAFRLDQSSNRPKWVKMEELGNWAIFISTDKRSQPLSFMNPERWGGRSNCVYCYSHDSERWAAFELGKPASNLNNFVFMSRGRVMQPMWVVPSMFSDLCL